MVSQSGVAKSEDKVNKKVNGKNTKKNQNKTKKNKHCGLLSGVNMKI